MVGIKVSENGRKTSHETGGLAARLGDPMRKSKFGEHQIIAILRAVSSTHGQKLVCEHFLTNASCDCASLYGGIEAANIRGLSQLKAEYRHLEQGYADPWG